MKLLRKTTGGNGDVKIANTYQQNTKISAITFNNCNLIIACLFKKHSAKQKSTFTSRSWHLP